MANGISMSYGEWCRKEVRVADRIVKLCDQEHKLVVALLARHPEHWIRAEELIDEMWGWSKLPDTWLKVLHVYYYRLRQRGITVEGRTGRATGGVRIHCRVRTALGDRVS